ncbi:mechanosensitive ion channel family protein [Aestuariibaculum sediminum]|uniref:Mechanosensitive ion channel family protein n=1 Tax=Aestuariibaculum sediminum TaxID=2770637 RepID=A0A8J6QHC9_9FLAO|nr:mechanosensitive ion channel family protein [Aestuariibaculum sediminum]MBD0831849.1 mechanosensitive ion channel family protein [Aestuariibaculum sediminum]
MQYTLNYLKKILEDWQQSVIDYIPKLFLACLVFIGFVLLARIVKKFTLKFYTKTIKTHVDIAKIITSVIFFSLVLSGVFLSLQILGLEKMLTKLLAGAGIVGIVAGFAFKDIASNYFSGLILKAQRPFSENDWVEINGTYGIVIKKGWITTSIKTVPGQEVFVPNQLIYNGNFTNYSTWQKRRIILKTGVSYGDDLEHVKTVALDEIKKIQQLLPDEGIDFYFTDIGASTYNFMLRYWVEFRSNDDFCKGMNDAIVGIKKRFEQENISIAYPVTTLDFGVNGGMNIFDKEIKVKKSN